VPELKVAAIQMDAQVGAVEANLAHATPLVEQAAEGGAQLIVLPELFSTGYEYTDRNYTLIEPLDGLTGTWIVETARRLGVHLVGSFPAWIDGKTYIVAKLAAPDGRQWLYHKIHVAMWENCYFDRGGEPVIADTDLGRIGLLICWDEVYADLARAYQGRVDLLCIPSSPPTFVGTLEDEEGNVLARLDSLRAFGQAMDVVDWFEQAQVAHARGTSVPVVYAARCGTFCSPIPYGSWLLLALGTRDALHVLRTAGSRFRVHCPMMGRSCILDAGGERLASTGQEGEAVLVATVQMGAPAGSGTPDPAALSPPKGTALIGGIPRAQFWFDGWMISLGPWYRQRHAPRG
jgi:predicted amidohydrolase